MLAVPSIMVALNYVCPALYWVLNHLDCASVVTATERVPQLTAQRMKFVSVMRGKLPPAMELAKLQTQVSCSTLSKYIIMDKKSFTFLCESKYG